MTLKKIFKSPRAQSSIEYLGVTLAIFLALLIVELATSMSPNRPYGGSVVNAFRNTADRVMSRQFGAFLQ